MGNTPVLALPYPEQTTQVNVPVDIKALADRLELLLANDFSSGLASARPAANAANTNSYYYATDTGDLSFNPLGIDWRTIASTARGFGNISSPFSVTDTLNTMTLAGPIAGDGPSLFTLVTEGTGHRIDCAVTGTYRITVSVDVTTITAPATSVMIQLLSFSFGGGVSSDFAVITSATTPRNQVTLTATVRHNVSPNPWLFQVKAQRDAASGLTMATVKHWSIQRIGPL